MKTLIFNGSPRVNGNTQSIIRKITAGLEGEYKVVNAYRCDVAPCIDCRYCWGNGGCAIRDEMQDIYKYIVDCDNILIASPIYFSELSGQLLTVASRLQLLYCDRYFRHIERIKKEKKGAVVLVGGGDDIPEKAYSTAVYLLEQMNAKEVHELIYFPNTNVGPALNNEKALECVEEVIRLFNSEN